MDDAMETLSLHLDIEGRRATAGRRATRTYAAVYAVSRMYETEETPPALYTSDILAQNVYQPTSDCTSHPRLLHGIP